jgi:phosphate transport system substrate-binding protein
MVSLPTAMPGILTGIMLAIARGAGETAPLLHLPPNLRRFITNPAGREAYPIVTSSWILLYKRYDDARKDNALRDLFRWCLNDGQRFAPELGFVPLSPNVTSKALAAMGDADPRN